LNFDESPPSRGLARIAFVASAAIAAAALRFAWQRPLVALAFLLPALAFLGSRLIARRRLERMLRAGDVQGVLVRWSRSLDRMPHAATLAPLLKATALAAYGRVENARRVLAAAERGPAWDEAIEHRLFLDTLLLTFEGDAEAALERASRLVRLPLPSSGRALRERVQLLRLAAAALARAFSHTSRPGDRHLLESAGRASPLVHWAMRYGSAIVAVDEGDLPRANALIEGAPNWPGDSAFRAFHDEIARVAGAA
jgi:hypothetical protein